MTIRILNFDNSVTRQRNLLSRYKNEVIDLTEFSETARIWMNSRTKRRLEERLCIVPLNSAAFLGSGDYHQISEILISHYEEPLSVIAFDYHPDWSVVPPRFGCGAWVSEILKRDNIKKVVLIGISSTDISTFDIQMGNIDSLKDDRVEIYPYSHRPTRVFLKRVPHNGSVKIKRSLLFDTLYWNELKDMDLGDFMRSVIARLPTKDVYVSIDKDCLTKDYALTNWEPGLVGLDGLILMLKVIKDNKTIAGFDITGEYSPPTFKGLVKRLVSYFDHPKNMSARGLGDSFVNTVNENTNLKILGALVGN